MCNALFDAFEHYHDDRSTSLASDRHICGIPAGTDLVEQIGCELNENMQDWQARLIRERHTSSQGDQSPG